MKKRERRHWWPNHEPEVRDALIELFGMLQPETKIRINIDVNGGTLAAQYEAGIEPGDAIGYHGPLPDLVFDVMFRDQPEREPRGKEDG